MDAGSVNKRELGVGRRASVLHSIGAAERSSLPCFCHSCQSSRARGARILRNDRTAD